MAEPFAFLLDSISKFLVEEGKFLSVVSDEAEKLHLELMTMLAFLKHADERQSEAAIVKELVSQCKYFAYVAADILDDYAFKVASRKRKKDTFSIVKRYACILNEFHIQHNFGVEIRSLNSRISDLTRRFQVLSMVAATEGKGSNSRQQLQQLRMTYPYVASDEDFVGFGDDVENLVEALVNEDNTHGVVSVYGMGGCGKTTLARKLYNHPKVKRHFASFAWVCISQDWPTRKILEAILVYLLPGKKQEMKNCDEKELVERLFGVLEEENCLVVLEDIWSIDAWECIKCAFPMGKKGNKLLLTTRNKDVAEHIGPNGYHHEPRLLTDDESLELLMKKAIRGQPHREVIENLRDLGEEMLKSCGGHPLAVVILGGILATKHTVTEWKRVCRNIKFYLGKGESMEQNPGEVQRIILAMSFGDLPYKLKHCFLYLSLFPEDELIDAKSLYGLWIAEGMVLAEDRMGDESMIEMADRYLEDLAKRCLVTVEESEIYTHGRYNGCRLHHILRDVCKAKAGEVKFFGGNHIELPGKVREENFLECLDYGGGNFIELSNSVYSSTGIIIPRIMISLTEMKAARRSFIQLQQGSKHLRTLIVSAHNCTDLMMEQILSKSQMKRFKMLRSLVLEEVMYGMCGHKLPVGKLIHLRLLRLRKSVLMMSPSSISNLERLEILDLRESEIRWTKNVPIKMWRLRYVDLSGAKSNFVTEIYVVDPNHLEVIYGLPSSSFYVGNLSQLTNVRDLGTIVFREDAVKGLDKIFKCISESHNLKHADIRDLSDSKVLSQGGTTLVAQLFRSNNVENIFLVGALGKLPEYDSHFLNNLLSLRLDLSRIEEDPMKILENLPKLQRLEFWYEAFVGKEMVCHSSGFPQLRFLLFKMLRSFETWTVEKGAMPNLSHLQIYSCSDQLQIIPEDELGFVTALKELEFLEMSEEFLERNINKFRHVPSIVVDGFKSVPIQENQ